MDGDLPAVTIDHDVVSTALSEGGYIASSGGSPDGPAGPDLVVAATGEVLASIERLEGQP